MPDVRSVFIKLLLSLATLPLLAADLPSMTDGANDSTVIEFAQETMFHSGRRWLEPTCRVERKIFGCTDFPDEILFCNCVKEGETWKIEGRAQIKAVIHVRTGDNATFLHELHHLQDIRQSLARHLSLVLAAEYPSQRTCELRARLMSSASYMHDVMNRLRLESNEKFGCS